MGSFAHLGRLSDVGQEDVLAATISPEECEALLVRLAEISAPGTGASVLLSIFAQIATARGTGWLEGDLAVELSDVGGVTRVRVMSEVVGGLRECALRTVTIRAPLSELTDGFERFSGILRLRQISPRCALLLSSKPAHASAELEMNVLPATRSSGADPSGS